jgi:hypothetical protein
LEIDFENNLPIESARSFQACLIYCGLCFIP